MGFIKDIINLIINTIKVLFKIITWISRKIYKFINLFITHVSKSLINQKDYGNLKERLKERHKQFNDEVL